MGLRRKRVVESVRGGGYRLNVEPAEREMLSRLAGELRDVVLQVDADDPRLRRLFPAAYHADPEADAEYQRLMREELVASRLAGVETVQAALERPQLTGDELYALMQGINSLRLVLGTMLDVGEDHDDAVAADHENAAELHLYDYLSWLLDHVVRALSEGGV